MYEIKTSEPKVLWKLNCILGEGTLWVNAHESIYFVDIKKKRINTKTNNKDNNNDNIHDSIINDNDDNSKT